MLRYRSLFEKRSLKRRDIFLEMMLKENFHISDVYSRWRDVATLPYEWCRGNLYGDERCARNLRGATAERQRADHLSEILPSRTCGVADREKINEIRNEIAIIASRLRRKYGKYNDTFFEKYPNRIVISPE